MRRFRGKRGKECELPRVGANCVEPAMSVNGFIVELPIIPGDCASICLDARLGTADRFQKFVLTDVHGS